MWVLGLALIKTYNKAVMIKIAWYCDKDKEMSQQTKVKTKTQIHLYMDT